MTPQELGALIRARRLAQRDDEGHPWSAQTLADQIQARHYRQGGGTLGITRKYVSEWETGQRSISAVYADHLSAILSIPRHFFVDRRTLRVGVESRHAIAKEQGIDLPGDVADQAEATKVKDLRRRTILTALGAVGIDLATTPLQHLAHNNEAYDSLVVELLRLDLDEAVGEDPALNASFDDWERTVFRHGRDTRNRPATALLADLSLDVAELKHTIAQYAPGSAPRPLVRVAAQISGLVCLTLIKLDQTPTFLRWARTARHAARRSSDPVTLSWVLAQEAHGHYYRNDLGEALEVAQQAQAVAGRASSCIGVALAAALEARVHAVLGRRQETKTALQRAEGVVLKLDEGSRIASAFGYNEAQLRFHEGNAYTHLRDSRNALRAQERALELCAPGDYTDWAMTRLDRANCLLFEGDPSAAVSYAIETLTGLTEQQRQGIINRRGYDLLGQLPQRQQSLPAAHDLRDLLVVASE